MNKDTLKINLNQQQMINPLNLYNLLMHGTIQSYYQQLDSFPFQAKTPRSKQAEPRSSGEALLLMLSTDPVTPPDYIYLQVSFDENSSENEVQVFRAEGEARKYFEKKKAKGPGVLCGA